MWTEDKKNHKTQQNYFSHKAKINSSLSVAINLVFILKNMTSPTIQNSTCLSYRQIKQTNIYILPYILFDHKHSDTFLIIPRSWLFDCETFSFQLSPSYLTTLCCAVNRCVIIPVGWYNVAKCTRYRRSFLSVLYDKRAAAVLSVAITNLETRAPLLC
jgi:hypothetical protein